jgi:ribosomal protein L37AE/L43A
MGTDKENTGTEKRVAQIFNLTSLISDPKLILEALGLVSSKVYKDAPEQCPVCKHKKFAEVSLLGVSPKAILWECLDCRAMFLRYSKAWVVKQFEHIGDIWTNLADWEVPDREDFN